MMRLVRKAFIMSVCVAGALLSVACKDMTPGQINATGNATAQVLDVLVRSSQSSDRIKGDGPVDYGYLDVRNTLNRSITLDFVGGGHYELTVGDSRTGRIKLPGGGYSVNVIAPGIRPMKTSISVENGRYHVLEVYQSGSSDRMSN